MKAMPPPVRLVARIDHALTGFRTFTFLLAKACRLAGAPNVEICAPTDWRLSAQERDLLGAGVSVEPLTHRMEREPGVLEIIQIANTPDFTPLLDRLVRHGGIALLHDPHPLHMLRESGHVAPALARQLGPLFGRLVADRLTRGSARIQELIASTAQVLAYILGHADGVIVHSAYAEGLARRTMPDLWCGRAFLIPNDPSQFDAHGDHITPAAIRPPNHPPVLGLLGGHARAKASLEALEALIALAKRGCHFGVRIAGEASPGYRARFEAAVRRLAALREVIYEPGRADDDALRQTFEACDLVFALRRRSNGESSGVATKAITYGAGVIACDVDAFADLPRDAVLWIEPYADDAAFRADLEAKLHRLLTSSSSIEAMRACTRVARESLSLRAYARRYADLLATAPLTSQAPTTSIDGPEQIGQDLSALLAAPLGARRRLSASAHAEAQAALTADPLARQAARTLGADIKTAALWRLGYERRGDAWRRVWRDGLSA